MISILMFAFYSFLKLIDHWCYGHSYWNSAVLGFIGVCFFIEIAVYIYVWYCSVFKTDDSEEENEEEQEEYVLSSRENEEKDAQLTALDDIRISVMFDEKCPYADGSLRADIWNRYKEDCYGFIK